LGGTVATHPKIPALSNLPVREGMLDSAKGLPTSKREGLGKLNIGKAIAIQ